MSGMPASTDLQLARAVVEALRHKTMGDLKTVAYDEFMARTRTDL
jgi:carbamoyl-phosphate synthase large subunit